MIEEVRRQFREIKGLLEGEAEPDSARCVAISTQAAIREMIIPGLLAVSAPVLTGFSARCLRSWRIIGWRARDRRADGPDDGQRRRGMGQRQEVHRGRAHGGQRVRTAQGRGHGDTVGDPFKDTSGPSLNILIKLMSIVAVIFAPLVVAWMGKLAERFWLARGLIGNRSLKPVRLGVSIYRSDSFPGHSSVVLMSRRVSKTFDQVR